MIHPDFFVPLTDVTGREFEIGDTVLVPVRHSTSRHFAPGGARLVPAKVRAIEPLAPMPGNWISTGPDSRTPFRRASQMGRKKATEFYPPVLCDDGVSRVGHQGRVDKSKCSIVSVEYENGTTGAFRYNDFVTR